MRSRGTMGWKCKIRAQATRLHSYSGPNRLGCPTVPPLKLISFGLKIKKLWCVEWRGRGMILLILKRFNLSILPLRFQFIWPFSSLTVQHLNNGQIYLFPFALFNFQNIQTSMTILINIFVFSVDAGWDYLFFGSPFAKRIWITIMGYFIIS